MGESTELWREAFEHFGQLADLEGDARDRAIEALGESRPDLYPHLVTLIRAQAGARAGAFLDQPAVPRPVPPVALCAGTTLGTYRLEHELGAGGMGEVWLARRSDGLFDAPVALKVLHAHLCASSARDRFVREGRILGQLSHPHIARLLDAGSFADGRMFLAIEYVEGERIDRWCDVRRLPIAARVRLFVQVCEAVAHAHARLVVHRDLKPSNILVTPGGEVKLLDFGIAKLIEPDTSQSEATELTRLGGRAMTPEYAAPEQVLGSAITTVTDVYALGMVLYVLLAGRRPYGGEGATLGEIERAVVEAEPDAPSAVRHAESQTASDAASLRGVSATQLRASLRGDLDTIVLKALKKAPGERYPSVDALAEDLRRVLDHRPVTARPDSMAYRARKYVRRHRLAVTAAGAVVLALALGIAGVLVQAHEARLAQQVAEQARRTAEDAERRALESAARVTRSKDFFVQIFQSASPFHRRGAPAPSVDAALDDAIRRLYTDLADDPRFQADLLDDLGELRLGQGDGEAARAMFDRAIALYEKTLGPDDPALAETLQNRGVLETYVRTDNVGAGIPYVARAVEILERHERTHAGALAGARTNLAVMLSRQDGRMEEAAAAVLPAVVVLRGMPDRAVDLAAALSYSGLILCSLGRFDEAEPYGREAVEVSERVFGPDTPNALMGLATLSQVAAERGDFRSALRLDERRVTIARKAAPTSTILASALREVADSAIAAERFDRAEAAVVEALDLLPRLQAPEDRSIVDFAAVAAQLVLFRDEVDKALAQLADVDTKCAALPFNAEKSACPGAGILHAAALSRVGRHAEALSRIDAAIAASRASNFSNEGYALSIRVAILTALGRHSEAVRDARDLQAKPGAGNQSEWKSVLAHALLGLGDMAAIAEAARLIASLSADEGKVLDRARLLVLRAKLARAQGRHDDATREIRDAVTLLEPQRPWSNADLRQAREVLAASATR